MSCQYWAVDSTLELARTLMLDNSVKHRLKKGHPFPTCYEQVVIDRYYVEQAFNCGTEGVVD